jgi:hypothetical protein
MAPVRAVVVGIALACAGINSARAQEPRCSDADTRIADAARYTARSQLDITIAKLARMDPDTKVLLRRWFGANDERTRDAVSHILSRAKQWSDGVSFYCLYQGNANNLMEIQRPDGDVIVVDGASGLFAYVRPTDMTRMVLGLAFFNAPEVGHDSRFGTIIHELTHYWVTGNTDDLAVGRDQSLKLAEKGAAGALRNADSYQYFVEAASR